jgi:hypothetical protein
MFEQNLGEDAWAGEGKKSILDRRKGVPWAGTVERMDLVYSEVMRLVYQKWG